MKYTCTKVNEKDTMNTFKLGSRYNIKLDSTNMFGKIFRIYDYIKLRRWLYFSGKYGISNDDLGSIIDIFGYEFTKTSDMI